MNPVPTSPLANDITTAPSSDFLKTRYVLIINKDFVVISSNGSRSGLLEQNITAELKLTFVSSLLFKMKMRYPCISLSVYASAIVN